MTKQEEMKMLAEGARVESEIVRTLAAALTGITEEQRAKIASVVADREGWQDKLPFERYHLANLRNRIRATRQRIVVLEARAAVPSSEERIGDVAIRDDADANRVQIAFPGKPDRATIVALKRSGFRWAPSVGVWQRMRGAGALAAARAVVGESIGAAVDLG
jgi:hypothetical protein